jgi:hypothetical protein
MNMVIFHDLRMVGMIYCFYINLSIFFGCIWVHSSIISLNIGI